MRVIALVLVLAWGLGAADDPFVGVWKVNFEKSTTTANVPPERPKSVTMRYEAVDGGMKVTGEMVMPDGQRRATPEHLVRYDGKEYPRDPKSPPGDVLINRRIDRRTEETVYLRNGKVASTATRVVSEDGRLMTSTAKGAGPGGKEVLTITVFDKQ